jgi:uncharacterized protein YbjT (DUF2867 family)
VLVVGATGFLGRRVVARLTERGFVVRALVRPETSARSLPAAVERVLGDLADYDSLARALLGMNAVVNAAGTVYDKPPDTYERVHVQGTRNLVRAATAQGVERLVHVSAIGARAYAGARFHQTKWQGEEAVRESRLRWTILRPAVMWGPGDRFVGPLSKALRRAPILPVIGHGAREVQPIHVEDVAEAVVAALERLETVGQSYDLVGPERVTVKELLQSLARAVSGPRWSVHVPTLLVKPLASALHQLLEKPPLTPDMMALLEEDATGDLEPLRRDLGLEPRPLLSTLSAAAPPQ